MKSLHPTDFIQPIPSPIDLRHLADAKTWTNEVNQKRPWRKAFFQTYVNEIKRLKLDSVRLLELGSGPGHCAKFILEQCLNVDYHAVDFSSAMHDLAKIYTGSLSAKINYHLIDFKTVDWFKTLSSQDFDIIIIHQALHELRHKAYAIDFHSAVQQHLLADAGIYFVTDHLYTTNAMQNNALYMSHKEHIAALTHAGFPVVIPLLEIKGLACFKAY